MFKQIVFATVLSAALVSAIPQASGGSLDHH